MNLAHKYNFATKRQRQPKEINTLTSQQMAKRLEKVGTKRQIKEKGAGELANRKTIKPENGSLIEPLA